MTPRRRRGACRGSGRRGVAVVALALGGGFALGLRQPGPAQPRFHQLTFRRGAVQGARFTADGQTIVYARGVGRAADGAVLDPARRPRSAAAADGRHRPLRDVVARARWPSCSGPQGFGRVEGTLARARAGRRPAAAAGARACWPPTGGPTDRSWRSSAAATAATCSSIRSDARSTIPARATSPTSAYRPVGDAVAILVHPVSGDTAGLGGAGRPGGPSDARCRPAGTACSAWPGRPTARRSGSPARAPARRRRCTR